MPGTESVLDGVLRNRPTESVSRQSKSKQGRMTETWKRIQARRLVRKIFGRQSARAFVVVRRVVPILLTAFVMSFHAVLIQASESPELKAENLLRTGTVLAEKTHYLEALEMFDEARDLLDQAGSNQTLLYSDVLFSLAQTKIKARIHQDFAASYVKSGLEEVQAANRLREKLSGVLPQKLAQGYYLEGYILKRFFRRTKQAVSCFVKAVNVDPGSAAAKRELSELVTGPENR